MDQKLSTKVDNPIMDTTVDSSKANEIQRNSSVEQVAEIQPVDTSANLLPPTTNSMNADPPPRITRRFVKPLSQEAILQPQARVENAVQPQRISTSLVPPTTSFNYFLSGRGRGNRGDLRQSGSRRVQGTYAFTKALKKLDAKNSSEGLDIPPITIKNIPCGSDDADWQSPITPRPRIVKTKRGNKNWFVKPFPPMGLKLSTKVDNPIMDTTVDSSKANEIQRNSSVEQIVEIQPPDTSANLLPPTTNSMNADPPPRITRRFVKPLSQEAILQPQARVENAVQPQRISTSLVPPTTSFNYFLSGRGRGNRGDLRQSGSRRVQGTYAFTKALKKLDAKNSSEGLDIPPITIKNIPCGSDDADWQSPITPRPRIVKTKRGNKNWFVKPFPPMGLKLSTKVDNPIMDTTVDSSKANEIQRNSSVEQVAEIQPVDTSANLLPPTTNSMNADPPPRITRRFVKPLSQEAILQPQARVENAVQPQRISTSLVPPTTSFNYFLSGRGRGNRGDLRQSGSRRVQGTYAFTKALKKLDAKNSSEGLDIPPITIKNIPCGSDDADWQSPITPRPRIVKTKRGNKNWFVKPFPPMGLKLSTKVDNPIMDTTVDSSKANEIQRNSSVEQIVEIQPPDTSSANLLPQTNSITVDPLSPQTTFQPGTSVVNSIIDSSGAEVVQRNVEQVAEIQPVDTFANLLPPTTNPINADPPPNSRITRRFVKPLSQEAILQPQARVENAVQPQPISTSLVPPTISYDFSSGRGRGNNRGRRQRGNRRGQSNRNNQQNGFNRNPKSNAFDEARFEQPNVKFNDNGWIIHDRGNSADFQTDAVYNVSNGHDAWTCFENLKELTPDQKEVLKDVENKLKRDAQDNFFPFLDKFFEKKISFKYENSKRMDLLRKFLQQELEKASLNISSFPRIIVNTQSDTETIEVVSVIQNFVQKIPFVTLSNTSTIDEVENATEQLFDKCIKILVVNSLCFVGKMDVYCDKVLNYSSPIDIESFVLRMQNIKKYYECENFILTQMEVDLLYQFAEIFKGAGFDVPIELKGFDVVPEGKTCPPLRDALINIFTETQHDFLTFSHNQKYAAVANYLKQLKDHAFNGGSLPRVAIFTNGYEETAKLTKYLKERNISCASINYDSSERDIKYALNRFYAKTHWCIIIADLIISEESFMSEIVINFSMPNFINEYVMRLHNLRYVSYYINYVSSYYDRFLLRNVANLLESGHYEIPSTLKELNAWSNCGSSKIDDYIHTEISSIPDDAMLISSTYEEFLMLEDSDKLNNCFKLLQENFKKVGGENIELMPKTLIIVNTKKEAENLVDLLEYTAYPCIYIPLNATEEDIQQWSKSRIHIIHEDSCESVKHLHYDYLVHYEMPNDTKSYLLRLKLIQHEKSVVFATKGKDSQLMLDILNILAASEHIDHFVNTLREKSEDENAGNDNDDEMETEKKDGFETFEDDVVKCGENEDTESGGKESINVDLIEDGNGYDQKEEGDKHCN